VCTRGVTAVSPGNLSEGTGTGPNGCGDRGLETERLEHGMRLAFKVRPQQAKTKE